MPYISQIKLPSSDNPYQIKDSEAFSDASFNNSTLTLKRRDYNASDSDTYLNINLGGIISANDAMVFKGTIGTGGTPGTLPTTGYNVGDTYRIIVAGTYAGQSCEIGDLIIAVKDYVSDTASNADWTVAQTNIDGAVTTSDGADGWLVKFNGAHSIVKLAQLGTSTTTYLNNKGEWGTPATVSHSHGNIAYGGTMSSTGVDLGNNDRLLFSDNSNSGKIERTSIVFDGSTTNKALTPKGTWESFLTAHQTYTAFTSGQPTENATPGFGETFTVTQISQNTTGQINGTDYTITIPNSTATQDAVGLIKPWYYHSAASTGPTAGSNSTAVTVNTITTTSNRYYAIEMDSAGHAFVNVPWETNTDEKLKIGAVTSGTTYYPIVATNSAAAATRQYDTNFIYKSTNGSTSATGTSILTIGNNAQKTTASREGQLVIYGSSTAATTLKVAATTTARTITFPDKTGTVLVGSFSAGTTPVTFSVSSEVLTIANGTAPSIS